MNMLEQKGFLTVLWANPLDLTCRLAYSDWLEEQGCIQAAKRQRDWCKLAERVKRVVNSRRLVGFHSRKSMHGMVRRIGIYEQVKVGRYRQKKSGKGKVAIFWRNGTVETRRHL